MANLKIELTLDQIRALPRSVELSIFNLRWFGHPWCNSVGVVKQFAAGPRRASDVIGTPSLGPAGPQPLSAQTTRQLIKNLYTQHHLEGCGLFLVKDPDDKNYDDPLYIMVQHRK